ncbi:MAG TPA: DNA alkylation repair protein [Streptosporangiaceae bacterium]|jgi:3-methyladenine DNA glycosylase AlkD
MPPARPRPPASGTAAGAATPPEPAAAREAAALEAALRAAGTPERAGSEQAYLKLARLEFTGTAVPAARAIVQGWRRDQPGLTRDLVTGVAAALWARPVFDCRMAAVLLLADQRALLTAGDVPLLERLLRDSGTWALVDSLAADVLGSLVERHPGLTATLDRWSADPDFWIRRSALLALLVPLRRGEGDFERFARYADQMLDEREFFIRKAIGWVLRETGKRRPDLVAAWLAPRIGRASGVTVREAVKPLPPAEREELLAAYRGRRPARSPGA